MTLYVGRHMIGMNQKRNEKGEFTSEWEAGNPQSESSLEYEIVDMSATNYNGHDETLFLKLKKVH